MSLFIGTDVVRRPVFGLRPGQNFARRVNSSMKNSSKCLSRGFSSTLRVGILVTRAHDAGHETGRLQGISFDRVLQSRRNAGNVWLRSVLRLVTPSHIPS